MSKKRGNSQSNDDDNLGSYVTLARRILKDAGGAAYTRLELSKKLDLSGPRLKKVLGQVIQDSNYHRQGSQYFWQP
jgi:hypothetical protein